jgi:NADH-quinone oxidoreductase subunit C
MTADVSDVISILQQQFPDIDFAPAPLIERGSRRADDQMCVRIPPDRVPSVMQFLHDDPRCRFNQMCDLTCIDYLEFPDATDRYAVVYSLLSTDHNHRLWAKCFVNDPAPSVPSVVSIWKGADWLEREVWDLFGVTFDGHPDLRRIVTWEGFEAHPLRKDYPLRGRGERESYTAVQRDSADVIQDPHLAPRDD